jgi:pyruvate dehydrogenase E2 component (dihydrolipoamide acetyltransferase)
VIFHLPDVGEGLAEAEIVQWFVAEGENIRAGEPLLSVETDKAVVDIPAPESGKVVKWLAQAGDVVATGKPLVELQTQQPTGQGVPASSTSVVGELDTREERLNESASRVEQSRSAAGATQVKVMPAVRALARKLDVDLSYVTPSGRDATITKVDVERVANRLRMYGPSEKLHGPRRAMAMAMSHAHAEVVPASLIDDVNVQHWPADTDVTRRLLRAMVAACEAEPALNAWHDSHAMARRVFDKVDAAIAMDTVDGLFTPVVRDIARCNDADLRAQIERIKRDVLARSISRDDLRDYTITLSNYGTIGGRYAVPVVMPPTVAIIGAGRIYPGVMMVDDQPATCKLLPLTLTFDHRAVTGGEAGRFLEALKSALAA